MVMYGSHLTETEFLDKLIATWGWDYVDDLIESGYLPVLTSDGWKMLLVRAPLVSRLTNG